MAEELEEQSDETDESSEESTEKEVSEIATEKMGNFFSPEAVIMMLLAIILDLTGFIILCFGLDDVGILDVIGLILIGGWMLSRSGQITVTKGAKKAGGKIFKRLGISFVGELIPYFGNVAPCWTLAVYFQLKSQ